MAKKYKYKIKGVLLSSSVVVVLELEDQGNFIWKKFQKNFIK